MTHPDGTFETTLSMQKLLKTKKFCEQEIKRYNEACVDKGWAAARTLRSSRWEKISVLEIVFLFRNSLRWKLNLQVFLRHKLTSILACGTGG